MCANEFSKIWAKNEKKFLRFFIKFVRKSVQISVFVRSQNKKLTHLFVLSEKFSETRKYGVSSIFRRFAPQNSILIASYSILLRQPWWSLNFSQIGYQWIDDTTKKYQHSFRSNLVWSMGVIFPFSNNKNHFIFISLWKI